MIVARRTVLAGLGLLGSCALPRGGDRVIHRDDFRNGLGQWLVEAEAPGAISAEGGFLDVDVPRGVTIWFRPELQGPIAIDYDAMAVSQGGANDQVSDVNCFWMAADALAKRRSGAFAEYDDLRMYYAGIGGNRNSTTRFRRYIGVRDNRPLLPQHDLGAGHLLTANRFLHIRLIADGRRIALLRDGAVLFELDDAEPYTRGHFGFRTTFSHLRLADFRVSRLV